MAHGLFPIDHGESMERMLFVYPNVVVGTVLSAESPAIPRSNDKPQSPKDVPLPADHPKAGHSPTVPPDSPPKSIRFTVQVEQVLHGELKAGRTIQVVQTGAYHEGVAWQVEHDPLMRNGDRYVLFLRESGKYPFLYGTAFGRFRITEEGTLAVVDPFFSTIPVVKLLEGSTLDGAEELIKSE